MASRLKMTAKRRARILERDGHRCVRCGSAKGIEIDHEIGLFFHDIDPARWPLSKLEDDNNLRSLCWFCHREHTNAQAAIRKKIRRITRANKPKVKRKWPKRTFGPSKNTAR